MPQPAPGARTSLCCQSPTPSDPKGFESRAVASQPVRRRIGRRKISFSACQLLRFSTFQNGLEVVAPSDIVHLKLCRQLSLPFFFYFFGSPATAARRVLKISRDTECGYRYISLFGRCLRLVSYAVRTLPRLWLRAFRPRSSLPSLSCPIEGVP